MKIKINCNPIFTIGHSTRPIDDFISLIKGQEITHLVDIRAIAGSRHNPQYNEESLRKALHANGIKYTHLPGLGGRRKPSANSLNTAWKSSAFRGFADYMQTPEFGENLCDLIELAIKDRLAIMCAEAVYWRCHRSLISDALLALKIPVLHILSPTSLKSHRFTPWAHVEKGRVTYPKNN